MEHRPLRTIVRPLLGLSDCGECMGSGLPFAEFKAFESISCWNLDALCIAETSSTSIKEYPKAARGAGRGAWVEGLTLARTMFDAVVKLGLSPNVGVNCYYIC